MLVLEQMAISLSYLVLLCHVRSLSHTLEGEALHLTPASYLLRTEA